MINYSLKPRAQASSIITFTCCLFISSWFTAHTSCAADTGQKSTRPNIVLIIADDLGYGDLSCYGATRIKTPNIDRLAAQGIRFTQGYAPSSTCTPTRYSILTGEYAWRQPSKKTGILDGDAPLCITPGRFTLPAMLQASGYKTGVVGKWHLGLGDGQTAVDFNQDVKPGPNEIGFGYSYIIPATVDRVPSVWIENSRVINLDPSDPIRVSYTNNISDGPCGTERPDLLKQAADKQHAGIIINGISRIGYMSGGKKARFKDEELASTVVRKSIDYISGNTNTPFFLYVGFFEPHVPRVAEPPFVGTSSCGVRGDVIQQLDWATGEILKALDRLNLSENTLVLLTSDNGPIFFDGYGDRSVEEANGHLPAGALRGYKYLVYEGACRVPLIARWPARVTPRVSNHLFNLVDLFATLAPLAGVKMPSAAARDSMDLSSCLLNQESLPLRDHTILHGLSDTLAIRQGDWKYIPSNTHQVPAGMGRGANPSDARFSESRIPEPLLFNLSEDPGEIINVIQNHPQIAESLRKLLLTLTDKSERQLLNETAPH